MSSLDHLIDQYFEEHFAAAVKVPADVSDDDAIRSVQEQFDDAGFDCSEETARALVRGLAQEGRVVPRASWIGRDRCRR